MKVFLDKVGGAIKKGAEAGTDATKAGVETVKDTVSLAKDSQAATDAQLKTAQEHLQQLKDNKDSLSLSDPKFDEKFAAMTKPEVLNVEVMKHFRADLSDSFLSGSSLKELSVDLYGKDAGSNFDVLSKLFNSDKPGVTKLLDDATAKYLTGSIDKTAYGKLLQDVLKAHNAPVAAA